jgi:hypothetical protein
VGFEHFCGGGDEGIEVFGGLLNQGQSVLEGLLLKTGDGVLDRLFGGSVRSGLRRGGACLGNYKVLIFLAVGSEFHLSLSSVNSMLVFTGSSS